MNIKCNKCNEEKSVDNFSVGQLNRKYILCKICISLINKQYRQKNNEKMCSYDKNKYQKHKKKILELKKEYYKKNKTYIMYKNNMRTKIRRKKDISFKIRNSVSASISTALRENNSSKKKLSCLNYLPYTIQELKDHLENQFEAWMSWNNHGLYKIKFWNDNDSSTWTWHIDHIIPQSTLLYTSMEDENFKKCWDLENLRPYSSKQNILDGNRKNIIK